jgi:thymidylate synthase
VRTLRSRNVNGLFYEGMHLLDECGEREQSRAGAVVVAPWPVMSVYDNPTERVLFCEKRDANPFFHLMEGLWMLAGRNDSAFLNKYVSSFGARFGEKDGTIHDAYGHRWRSEYAFGFDQLNAIIEKLRVNPQDRQCVLTMWDPQSGNTLMHPDSLGHNDLLGNWRGRPCNTHVYFRVREQVATTERSGQLVLDMTICCRSNDAIWGAHGANAVHFSMLQEYLAGRLGIAVGALYQLSSNYHGYVEELDKIGDPVLLDGDDPYENGEVHAVSMGEDWEQWDEDLSRFMKWHDTEEFLSPVYVNEWFRTVAERVAWARWQWTHALKHSARETAEQIAAPDWRRACLEWMDRRGRSK